METNFNLLMNRYIRNLVYAGYCPDCASILISPYILGSICDNCQQLFKKQKLRMEENKNAKTDEQS